MQYKNEKSSNIDIYTLLVETEKKKEKKERKELLSALKVKEFFSDGNITINKKTCEGIECRLCLEACPTNALYWNVGEIGIVKELCIYCGACVLSCIVDDCINIIREKTIGELERFSNVRDFVVLQHQNNAKKRIKRITDNFRCFVKLAETLRL